MLTQYLSTKLVKAPALRIVWNCRQVPCIQNWTRSVYWLHFCFHSSLLEG